MIPLQGLNWSELGLAEDPLHVLVDMIMLLMIRPVQILTRAALSVFDTYNGPVLSLVSS